MKRENARKYFFWVGVAANVISFVLALVAEVLQRRVLGNGQFVYYTVLSNMLAQAGDLLVVYFLLRERFTGKQTPRLVRTVKLAGAIGVSVTFLVCVFVLAPTSSYYRIFLSTPTMFFHHLVCPWLTVLTYVFTDRLGPAPTERLPLSWTWLALIPSFLYTVVSITLNYFRVWRGPYFFLLVHEQPWYMSLFWVSAIVGLMIAVGFGLRAIGEREKRKSKAGKQS